MRKGIKKSIITLLILASCTVLTGCGFHYSVERETSSSNPENDKFSFNFGFGGGSNRLDKEDAKEFQVEKSVVDTITSISVITGFADVELIEADNFYVDINCLYWKEAPAYSIKDGKLSFDDSISYPNSYSINFNLENTIKIYLPKDTPLSSLSIVSSSGNVKLAGFVSDDMDITVSYGDLTVKNAASKKADITLSSGTSKFSDYQVKELNFTNSYGNASFTNINTGEALLPQDSTKDRLEITMSSGNVDIKGMNTDTVDITDSYGNITITDIVADAFHMELSSGDLDVNKADLQDIDVSDSYGNVTLNLIGQDTDYYMDLSTSYGKVKVGNKSYDQQVVIDKGGSRKVKADLSSGDVFVKFE